MAEKSKYNVLNAVDHNGKRYEPGKSIDLTDEEAEPLLATVPPVIEAPAAGGKKDK